MRSTAVKIALERIMRKVRNDEPLTSDEEKILYSAGSHTQVEEAFVNYPRIAEEDVR